MSPPSVKAVAPGAFSSPPSTPTTTNRPFTVFAEAAPKTPPEDRKLFTFLEILQTTPPGFESSTREAHPNTFSYRTRSSSITSVTEAMKSKKSFKSLKSSLSSKSKKSKAKSKDKGTNGSEASPMAPAATSAGASYTPIVVAGQASASNAGSSTQVAIDPRSVSAYKAAQNRPPSPSGIPEPTEPELCFPGFGANPNIHPDAQIWYRGIRVIVSYGVQEMNFSGGKFKNVLHATYPLRDTLNKIMWDDSITRPESATLVYFGRLYARAQGDSRDGHIIDKAYLAATGMDGLQTCLAQIFKDEFDRRARRNTRPGPEVIDAVTNTIARLELQAGSEAGSAKGKHT